MHTRSPGVPCHHQPPPHQCHQYCSSRSVQCNTQRGLTSPSAHSPPSHMINHPHDSTLHPPPPGVRFSTHASPLRAGSTHCLVLPLPHNSHQCCTLSVPGNLFVAACCCHGSPPGPRCHQQTMYKAKDASSQQHKLALCLSSLLSPRSQCSDQPALNHAHSGL